MKILVACLLLLCLCLPVCAAKGTVVRKKSGCDYYIVDYGASYAVLEHYTGVEPDVDDTIVGDFESYGFSDFYDLTQDDDCNEYVEDYLLSKQRAIEIMYEKCE